MFFDRNGNTISLEEWATLRNDLNYVVVGFQTVTSHGTNYCVSTVWTGIDDPVSPMRWKPIFATIVFRGTDEITLGPIRSATETEARTTHANIVNHVATL